MADRVVSADRRALAETEGTGDSEALPACTEPVESVLLLPQLRIHE
jgi:hypothetical protein